MVQRENGAEMFSHLTRLKLAPEQTDQTHSGVIVYGSPPLQG